MTLILAGLVVLTLAAALVRWNRVLRLIACVASLTVLVFLTFASFTIAHSSMTDQSSVLRDADSCANAYRAGVAYVQNEVRRIAMHAAVAWSCLGVIALLPPSRKKRASSTTAP